MTINSDKPKEECGVIAIYAPNESVASMTYFGLHALQHRGQEAAGMAVSNGTEIHIHKDMGLVSQIFHPGNLEPLQGHLSIGHTRYSTTGISSANNAQPFLIDTQYGPLAVAHNGNLINAAELRQNLLTKGIGLAATSDSKVMTMMLAGAAGDTWEARIRDVMPQWKGAYSLVILTQDQVFAVRDPWGFRPLSIGKLPNGGYAAASETCALQTLGCTDIREVLAGEIINLGQPDGRGMPRPYGTQRESRCTFEHIYFSRPDSNWDGQSIHKVRQRLGAQLWKESPADVDMIIPVPDSAIPAAIGYSHASGIPYNQGFIKNRYIGRTFIQPTDSLRRQGIAMKFNALPENLAGKRVVMVDDSIVRGNTAGPLVKLLRNAGAKEVHLRITCPPITHPCYMGVDMGSYEELIAHHKTIEEMCTHFGCDSLGYLSLEGLMLVLNTGSGYCNACFTGKYPVAVMPAQAGIQSKEVS